MNWTEFLKTPVVFGNDIKVTILNPVRKDDWAKEGMLTGFKCGIWGGGHWNFKNGMAKSFSSSRMHWKKKPKVHVTYNAFEYGKSFYSDWVDVDNCDFNIDAANL